METPAFLFPGIGVRLHGREHSFFIRYRDMMEPLIDASSEAAGVDLTRAFMDNDLEQCSPICIEFFAYGFSYGCHRVFESKGYLPRYMAGHSMGIYAALAASGAISFEDGLAICLKAHEIGETLLAGRDDFGVGVVVGLDFEELNSLARQDGYHSVSLANYNNSSSTVWVGQRQEVSSFLEESDKRGALKSMLLNIAIPFHSTFFSRSALDEFRSCLEKMEWHPPRCPLVSALDHSLLDSVESLRKMTVENLTTPLHWPGVLQRLHELGVGMAMECGPGISLTQHSRFVDGAPKHLNMKNLRRRLDY
ncbi:MAG: ACP S-malonyltransferase [Thermodesulfobacteriota bacterium]